MTGKTGRTLRNILLLLGAAVVVGTSPACSTGKKSYDPAAAQPTPIVQVIEGQPLGVASNCYGGDRVKYCDLHLVVRDSLGQDYNLGLETEFDMHRITSIDAAVQAEMNDGDNDTIEVGLDTTTTPSSIDYVTVGSVKY